MKRIFWLALLFLLVACQVPPAMPTIDIIDGDEHIVHATELRVPAQIFAEAGISFNALEQFTIAQQGNLDRLAKPTTPRPLGC